MLNVIRKKDIHHWPASLGNTFEEFQNKARIKWKTKKAGHFLQMSLPQRKLNILKLNRFK